MLGERDTIIIEECTEPGLAVLFVQEGQGPEKAGRVLEQGNARFMKGEYLETAWLPVDGRMALLVGLGKKPLDRMKVKEVCAKAVAECIQKHARKVSMDVAPLIEAYGTDAVRDIVEGALLGTYRLPCLKGKPEEETEGCVVSLLGIPGEKREQAKQLLEEAAVLAEGVGFVRDMVNMPANRLRPEDFVRRIQEQIEGLAIETVCYTKEELARMGMDALLAVGGSSQFPPCLLVLRYQGAPDCPEITGLVGKGVTCDTGGYCLKSAGSMEFMKGDMAGAAAVVGAVYALAKRKAKANATAVIPMCENRISSGALLPGDVISSYSGKTIEVGNTDAEGRLILADAVSYAVRDEHVTRVLDIATLTGAVVNMFGFSIAGVLCDEEGWYQELERASAVSGERYARIPFYDEHEKMLKSELADLKNISKDGCGTITAGLFIREFAEGKPWMHLDIAGTAWVNKPVFAFQSKGATGAGVTTLYQLCQDGKATVL